MNTGGTKVSTTLYKVKGETIGKTKGRRRKERRPGLVGGKRGRGPGGERSL